MALLLFCSCSPKRKQKTSVTINIGNLFVGSIPTGGTLILGRNTSGTERFILDANKSDSIQLPNGTWEFASIAWEGSSKFSGPVICDKVEPIELKGENTTVSFTLSSPACNDLFFKGTTFSGTSLPNLIVENCNRTGFNDANQFTSNCTGKEGLTRSFRISLQIGANFDSNLNSIVLSNCFDVSTGSPSVNTGLQFPLDENFQYQLLSYDTKGCTGGTDVKNLGSFASGLRNKTFFDTSNLKLFSFFKANITPPYWRYSADQLYSAVVGNYAYSIKLAPKTLEVYSLSGNNLNLVRSLVLPFFPRDIAKISENHIAVAANNLYIYNVSDPLNPYIESTYTPSGGASYGIGFDESSNILTLALGASFVDIVDLTDKSTPTLIQTYSSTENFRSAVYDSSTNICVFGGPADTNIDILDCSNLNSPTHIADFNAGQVYGLNLIGNILYISNNGANKIVDLTTPSTPSELSSYGTGIQRTNFISENYLHASDSGLIIYDVTNPSSPTITDSYVFGGEEDVDLVDTNKTLVTSDRGLAVVDTANKSNIIELSKIITFIANSKIEKVGNFIISGGAIIDVSNPSKPIFNRAFPDFTNEGIVLNGNLLYILSNPIKVYDVSDPNNFVLLGQSASISNRKDMSVSGNYAYVTTTGGFFVYDISNPSSITQVGSNVSFTFPWGNAFNAGYVFIADTNANQLVSVDVSDPTNPTISGTLALNNGRNVFINGNYAYVTTGGTLEIVDISNPASMTLAGNVSLPGNHIGMDIDSTGSRLFVASSTSGVNVVDITNPSSPALVTTFKGNLYDSDYVKYSNGYLYVSDTTAGVGVINVQDPDNPHQ